MTDPAAGSDEPTAEPGNQPGNHPGADQPGVDIPTLVGLEYVVDDLDRALELFVDLLGFVEVARQPHPHVDADIITLDAGTIAVNLLHRTAVGDRPQILEGGSNLTQLIFTVPGTSQLDALRTRLAEAGTGIVVDDEHTVHLSAQSTKAILGQAPALVFRTDPGAIAGDA